LRKQFEKYDYKESYWMSLAVISTHPVQYHAPVYRYLQLHLQIPVTAIYGSDFSIAGYYDQEFRSTFAWDSDLVSGYSTIFLSRVSQGGANSYETVSARGSYSQLNRIKPKVVLLVGYSTKFHRSAFWSAYRYQQPLMMRAETTDHARQRSGIKQTIRDTTLKLLYKQFFKLLYIGNNSLKHYQRLECSESKLIFSPYCVDTSLFELKLENQSRLHLETRKQFEIPSDKIVLLFSGKLVFRKGADLLLTAYEQCEQALRENIVIVFMGDGEMRAELEEKSSRYDEIRFIGFQNQSQISSIYHMADLLVVPSRTNETWGLVVNEALHHGLPCIVSDQVGCAPDLVEAGVTGEIFTSDSVVSLIAAIERALLLLRDSHTPDKCRQIVDNYTVEKAAKGIALAYQQILSFPQS